MSKRPALSVAAQLRRLAGSGLALGALVGVPTAFQMLFADPAPATASATPTMAIARGSDGLYHAQIAVAGKSLECLVDTGATNLTIPARAVPDVETVGARTPGQITTAAGVVRADRVTLNKVAFAGRHFDDVPAVLVKGQTSPCLIGQDLLARLDAVEIHSNRLHLR
jgi:clan AA aspartic protease (TIGR02281 family)